MSFWDSLNFLYHLANAGNLLSSSSYFSEPNLDKFLICIMLKPSMQDFKHDLTSMGDERNHLMLAHSWVLLLLGIGMRIDLFQSCGHCWVFQICWHNECKALMVSSFRDLNSSAGISLHPLALLTAVLPKTPWLHTQNVWLWVTNHTIAVIQFIKTFLIQFFHRPPGTDGKLETVRSHQILDTRPHSINKAGTALQLSYSN